MTSDSTADTRDGILPWTRSCFVCGQDNPRGLRLKSRVEGDLVVLQYVTRDADLGWRHLVHGGITATLLDEVMTWAAILAARKPCVAAEITTRMLRPIEVPSSIRVEGRVSEVGRRLLVTAGKVLAPDGTPLAAASGKYVPMPRGRMDFCREDFVASPESIDPAQIMKEY